MAKAFLDSDDSTDEDGGVAITNGKDFKINEQYAQKFAYNKKREELQQLEEKHGKTTGKRTREEMEVEDSEDNSTSEDEDDAGELATETLDSEIFATLNAIRSKDPKVYDPTTTFYRPIEEEEVGKVDESKKEKPLFLRDYHRETLLNGNDTHAEHEPLSYTQEQEALKSTIVAEMHAAGNDDSSEDEMLIAKKSRRAAKPQPTTIDVDSADQDPEGYLNKFLSARAWVPTASSRFQALESDDSEDERRAEEFEEAYNLRFEDPAKSNEKLRTHDREIAAKYSVRRDEANPRKKKRELEREKKERAKQQLGEEKARLRKLRIEEIEEKVRRIKRAAGLKSKQVKPADWAEFVDEDWDDARWEVEMQARFGADYYQDEDVVSDDNTEPGSTAPARKVKKPKFDDDIDIKDIIPGFVSDEDADFSMTEEEAEQLGQLEPSAKRKEEKGDQKKVAKKERKMIEQLVDHRLGLDVALRERQNKDSGFRYRDTSPTSFGLSARDILMADDSQLNQFAGLKKLAAFRDPAKKKKDRKHLGKKARLRSWRKETFGDEEGSLASDLFSKATTGRPPVDDGDRDAEDDQPNVRQGARKKKRRRSKRAKVDEETVKVD